MAIAEFARFEEGKTYIGVSRRDTRDYICVHRGIFNVHFQSEDGIVEHYISRWIDGEVTYDFQYLIEAKNVKTTVLD